MPPRQQSRHAVHIPHEQAEFGILGVLAVGVEVGRAVGIREGCRVKGVGHKVVHAPHQHIVCQPFAQAVALGPAVSAEEFAHASPAGGRVQVPHTAAQFAQHIGEEFAVPAGAVHPLEEAPVLAGGQLLDDHVDARHILVGHGPEEMPRPVPQAAVGVVVLDGMADMPAAVVVAPAAQHAVEVFAVQAADQLHVGVAQHMGVGIGLAGGAVHKEQGQQRAQRAVFQHGALQFGGQQLLQTRAPGQDHLAVAADGCPFRPVDVAEAGFIGEKPCKVLPNSAPKWSKMG